MCQEIQSVPWCYLFIHHRKVDVVSHKLGEQFRTFIHKSLVYKREDKRVTKREQPTVSGLVFVQGDCGRVQQFLSDNFFGLHLVKDCSTGHVAVIDDRVMQSFIRVSQFNPTQIRFMLHTIDYYADGNPLVRITSGVLAGMEGYRIRIARNKCLVTSMAGMTVAISGIHKDSFENLEDYARLRHEQLNDNTSLQYSGLTPLQAEIDRCFFTPRNPLDVMAIAQSLIPWTAGMHSAIDAKDFERATEIALFLLEESGSRVLPLCGTSQVGDCKEILAICREADRTLLAVISTPGVSTDLKEIAESGRESLFLRFPFLPIDL